jgi:hypothetical protein
MNLNFKNEPDIMDELVADVDLQWKKETIQKIRNEVYDMYAGTAINQTTIIHMRYTTALLCAKANIDASVNVWCDPNDHGAIHVDVNVKEPRYAKKIL